MRTFTTFKVFAQVALSTSQPKTSALKVSRILADGLQTAYLRTLNIENVLFAAEVKALNDLWLVGDAFLRSMFPALQALKTDQNNNIKKRKDELPYLYKYFNVITLFTALNGSADGSLYRTFNALIEGFNENVKLPRYILMLLDCDVIVHTDFFTYGVKPISRQKSNG